MDTPLAVDFQGAITDGFSSFATFIPKLLGFLLILIIGYFIAKIVAKVVNALLEKAGFDRAVERGGIKKALAKSKFDASDIVAKLVFYAIFIPFLSAAVGTLGISALQEPLSAFIALIPRIIVGVILVVIGAVIAGAAKKLIENSLGGLSYGSILANAAGILVLLVFIKAALDQVGIATQVTSPILYAILAAVVGTIVVGVGGGLIKPMQGRWETALNSAASEGEKVRSEAKSNKGSATKGMSPKGEDASSSASTASTTTSIQR